MKAYLYINPKAPGEVKDLLAEHFSDVSRVSSVFMQEVKSEQHACISSSSLIVLPAKGYIRWSYFMIRARLQQ